MTIAAFDKTNLKTLRAEIDEALRIVSERHGIAMSLGNISFNAGSFKSSLEAVVKTEANSTAIDAGVSPKWVSDYTRSGMDKFVAPLGTEFRYGCDVHKIVGGKPKSSKSVITKNTMNGKFYTFEEELVKQLISKS